MRDMQTQDAHILRNKHICKKLFEDKRSHLRIKDQIYDIIQWDCYSGYLLGLHDQEIYGVSVGRSCVVYVY